MANINIKFIFIKGEIIILKKIIILIALIIIGYFSALIGYTLYEPSSKIEIQAQIASSETQDSTLNQEKLFSSKAVGIFDSAKITPSTKITYKYYYTSDQITQVVEDIPAYFLINLSRNDLEESFPEWQIEKFSNEEVILKKTIQGQSIQHYIIKELEGYIAVYYNTKELQNTLKELTDISIESLSEHEKENIKNGIEIDGDEKLVKFLENYHS